VAFYFEIAHWYYLVLIRRVRVWIVSHILSQMRKHVLKCY